MELLSMVGTVDLRVAEVEAVPAAVAQMSLQGREQVRQAMRSELER
jgi:hypothetical protein